MKVPELAESSAAAAGVAIIEGGIELETDGEAPFAGKCVGVPGLGEELVALPGVPPREGIAEGSGTVESPFGDAPTPGDDAGMMIVVRELTFGSIPVDVPPEEEPGVSMDIAQDFCSSIKLSPSFPVIGVMVILQVCVNKPDAVGICCVVMTV